MAVAAGMCAMLLAIAFRTQDMGVAETPRKDGAREAALALQTDKKRD